MCRVQIHIHVKQQEVKQSSTRDKWQVGQANGRRYIYIYILSCNDSTPAAGRGGGGGMTIRHRQKGTALARPGRGRRGPSGRGRGHGGDAEAEVERERDAKERSIHDASFQLVSTKLACPSKPPSRSSDHAFPLENPLTNRTCPVQPSRGSPVSRAADQAEFPALPPPVLLRNRWT